MKVRLLHTGTEGNRANFIIEPSPEGRNSEGQSYIRPEDVLRVAKEIDRITAMANKQLGSMVLDIIPVDSSAKLVLKVNEIHSLEFRQFRGWLALFLDEPSESKPQAA